MTKRSFSLLLSPLLLLSLAGCTSGGNSGPEVPQELKINNPVSGQVIMEGDRSPEYCRIYFYKEDETEQDKSTSRGACDAFGYFTMQTASTNDGVPPGKYKVLFFQSVAPGRGGTRESSFDALGGKYNDVNNPQFTVEIPKGGKNDLQFKVTPLTKEELDAAMKAYAESRNRGTTREGQGKKD